MKVKGFILQFECPHCCGDTLTVVEKRIITIAPYIYDGYVEENERDYEIYDRAYICGDCNNEFLGSLDEMFENGILKEKK